MNTPPLIKTRAQILIMKHAWPFDIRVRLKIIGKLETMHDSDLPTVLIISLPIFKRTRSTQMVTSNHVDIVHVDFILPHQSPQPLRRLTCIVRTYSCNCLPPATPLLLDVFVVLVSNHHPLEEFHLDHLDRHYWPTLAHSLT
eukprot:COSAG05_NODE_985_length_6290_cov_2.922953_2_plen_142_part_00